jgi:hypothetical protein
MNSDAALSIASEAETLAARRPRLVLTMEPLTPLEIEKLVAACRDTQNNAIRDLFAYSGARTVTGIIARLTIVPEETREVIHALIRRAIAEHESNPAD